jgi:hypothetical protein
MTRLPISLSPSVSLPVASSSTSPPLAWIDEEPFIIELQGSLELPGSEKGAADMSGVIAGKLDLVQPVRFFLPSSERIYSPHPAQRNRSQYYKLPIID